MIPNWSHFFLIQRANFGLTFLYSFVKLISIRESRRKTAVGDSEKLYKVFVIPTKQFQDYVLAIPEIQDRIEQAINEAKELVLMLLGYDANIDNILFAPGATQAGNHGYTPVYIIVRASTDPDFFLPDDCEYASVDLFIDELNKMLRDSGVATHGIKFDIEVVTNDADGTETIYITPPKK